MVAQVKPPKVLVIDDEDLFREMLGHVLGGDFEVLGAATTDDGLQLFEREHPDAILLDLVMPGRSGIQGLKAIRAVDPSVAVIIVTGHARLETAKEAMSLGANYYVEKPVDPEDLRRTVRRCVERTQIDKRRTQVVEEMTGMIRQLTTDLEQKRQEAAQSEAAVELMYDLVRPLTDALAEMKQLNSLLAADDATPQKKLASISGSLGRVEWNVQMCRELSEMCRDLSDGTGRPDDVISGRDLVDSVLHETASWAAAAGVRIDFRVLAQRGRVKGDAGQLLRALKHLMATAIRASAHDSGVVRGACLEDKTGLEIRIEDHGGGYDMDAIQREMGARFGRREVAKGAAMGFCLANRIIESHGGYLHVRTAPGKGTVVFIKLPLAV